MSDTDPLAHERFRTILTDAVESTGYDAYANGLDADPDVASSKVIGLFPEAYFEHRTNDAGVRVRRVVVASEWEVDPEPAPVNSGRCTDPACSTAYIPNHAHMTQAGQQAALAEVLEALRADSDSPLSAPAREVDSDVRD
jgi:hypothetical protein